MALFKFYFLSALICGVLILGQAAEVPTLPPTSYIDLKPTPTEAPHTPPETTTPTTTEPFTTETTSTTPPPTTSTTPPPTTSTTPPTTTSTTTPSPTTTSTTTPAPPTTTPAPPEPPKPIGPPDQGLWAYTDSKNVTCVIVQFAAQLNVTYPKPNSSNSELYNVLVNVPANASVVSGNCDGAEQWLTLSWPGSVNKTNTLTVLFAKNDTTKYYEMKSLNASLVASMFPNFTNVDSVELYHGVEWQTPLASSYRCAAATRLKLTAEQANFAAMLTLSRLQEEAFRTQRGDGFSAARDCAGGDIPDAVPIVVGCVLGGLVVVVLVAYLVARRRAAARGYLSM